jgi:hypothetical protein
MENKPKTKTDPSTFISFSTKKDETKSSVRLKLTIIPTVLVSLSRKGIFLMKINKDIREPSIPNNVDAGPLK